MGWDVPVMAHIPLIHGADGAKLSKRHGALGVDAYRAMGYLPIALRNYLVRLGWSHGDDEIMSTEDMISWFDIDDINKGAARFDFKKLEAINGQYMRMSDDKELFDAAISILPEIEGGKELLAKLDEKNRAEFLKAMPELKERAKTLVELIDNAAFIFAERPLKLDEKASNLLNEDGKAVLKALYPVLENCTDWNKEQLDKIIRHYAEDAQLKLGKVAQPLRAALTGRAVSPGVFDVLVILGREESLGRVHDQIA